MEEMDARVQRDLRGVMVKKDVTVTQDQQALKVK
jgi:hypothetical protein